jgi:hypothetical protein
MQVVCKWVLRSRLNEVGDMADILLQAAILEKLEGMETALSHRALQTALTRSVDAELPADAVAAAVLALQQQGRIRVDHPPGAPQTVRLTSTEVEPRIGIIERESDLEPHLESYLWRNFRDQFGRVSGGSDSVIIQNTARGGSLDGIWKNPDLTAAVVSRYEYHPFPVLELIGFELKMPKGCTVPAVHEALSHTAHVHFAYLVIYTPHAYPISGFCQFLSQAQQHGIGVITMAKPADETSYRMHLEAQRKQPTLRRIDEFINRKFHRTHRQVIQTWLGVGG